MDAETHKAGMEALGKDIEWLEGVLANERKRCEDLSAAADTSAERTKKLEADLAWKKKARAHLKKTLGKE